MDSRSRPATPSPGRRRSPQLASRARRPFRHPALTHAPWRPRPELRPPPTATSRVDLYPPAPYLAAVDLLRLYVLTTMAMSSSYDSPYCREFSCASLPGLTWVHYISTGALQ